MSHVDEFQKYHILFLLNDSRPPASEDVSRQSVMLQRLLSRTKVEHKLIQFLENILIRIIPISQMFCNVILDLVVMPQVLRLQSGRQLVILDVRHLPIHIVRPQARRLLLLTHLDLFKEF